ncbi:MAG: hypothetical protein Q9182_001794 [Xanthomendoza sp. 2 TL-2023]
MHTPPIHESQQLPATAQDFCSRAQHRISPFFHGHSVLTKERYKSPLIRPKAAHPGHSIGTPEVIDLRAGGRVSRSRTSTRSLIDPISSPISSPGSPHREELWHYRGAYFRPVPTLAPAPRHERRIDSHGQTVAGTRQGGPSLPRKHDNRRSCLPNTKDRRIKYKVIGSVISGTLLALFLAIYLALAISTSVRGQAFHVVFIIFILIFTMVFCHCLIRLSMLSLQFRVRGRRRAAGGPRQVDDEECAQPQTPIPIILARDEELGLNDLSSDGASIRRVQHPPPAYGLWRSSVRADPDLIHWQRTDRYMRQCEGDTPDLAQHPALRPPSYYSREQEASSSLYSASPVAMPEPLRFRH